GATYSEENAKQYFYHSDHLGSASLISDKDGNEYQRIEYTPYGETWVEKTQNTGLEWLPYKFTAKEMDEETGLYYYGARYLDPKYSRWLSTDPAMSDYMAGSDAGGGAYNATNFSLYNYGNNNPIVYQDPDGRSPLGFMLASAVVSYIKNNMPSKEEHFNRNDNQKNFSYNRVEDALASGFTKLGTQTGENPENLDNCHENGKGSPSPSGNDKYTMSDGKNGSFELVYDSNGDLVTDEVNKGTYNFADPVGPKGKLEHGVKDLLPYLLYGNSEDDPTTGFERFLGTVNFPVGKYDMDVNLSKQEADKIRAQKSQESKEAAMERYYEHHLF
ncbi:MAG: RHS repeat-associated core domain-containing protein, partial [Treponema sp.]|nr:RHS repeat-associated core domain-containing protein [Treponema sp.]